MESRMHEPIIDKQHHIHKQDNNIPSITKKLLYA